MPNNRSVGSPADNRDIQARDVPVQHDKPRLNDQRKVRPHAASDPRVGVRPSGGHQTAPKAPATNQAFMQKREVPVKKVTEAGMSDILGRPGESMFSRFFKSKRDFIPGDAVGYVITRHGVDLYHVKDGQRVGGAKRMDSYETMTRKMEDLKQQYADLKQGRRELSINPKRAAVRLAKDFAREQGFYPSKIGELNTDIPTQDVSGAPAAAAPASTAPGSAAPTAPAAPAPGPATSGAPYRTSMSGSSSMTHTPMAPMSSSGGATGSFGNNATPAWAAPASAAPASAAPASAAPASAATDARPVSGGATIPERKNFLYKADSAYFPPGSLDKMTDWQINQTYAAFMGAKETPMMKKNKAAARAAESPLPMAAESYYPSRGHVGRTLKTIKGMGMRATHDPDSGEFRVAHRDNNEDSAYYTDDHEDAIGTAQAMKKHAMGEGYPDTSFERDEPSHESKVKGSFYWTRKPTAPGTPDLNREFAQFCDINVEKVTEIAEREMDQFFGTMLNRMGIAPVREAEEEAEEDDDAGLKNPIKRVGKKGDSKERPDTQVETIVRGRARWV